MEDLLKEAKDVEILHDVALLESFLKDRCTENCFLLFKSEVFKNTILPFIQKRRFNGYY